MVFVICKFTKLEGEIYFFFFLFFRMAVSAVVGVLEG